MTIPRLTARERAATHDVLLSVWHVPDAIQSEEEACRAAMAEIVALHLDHLPELLAIAAALSDHVASDIDPDRAAVVHADSLAEALGGAWKARLAAGLCGMVPAVSPHGGSLYVEADDLPRQTLRVAGLRWDGRRLAEA